MAMTQTLTHYFTGDKRMWTQTKDEEDVISSPETSCIFLCLTRDPSNNEEWDPWQLSVIDFMIFKWEDSQYFEGALTLITKPLSYNCIIILQFWKCVYCLFSHLFNSFPLWPAACYLWPENWILMLLESEIK